MLAEVKVLMKAGILAAVLVPSMGTTGHSEISGGVVRIGVLTDLTGPFSAWAGEGSVVAARMAVEEFTKERGAVPYRIEVVSADFHLKPDVATTIARQWMHEGIDAIVDVPQSGAALAVNNLARGSSIAVLFTGAQHDDLTTKDCSPNAAQWTFDSSALTRPTVAALSGLGANSWFFVTVDLAGGKSMEEVARASIEEMGGKTLGGVRTPVNSTDFASFLLQATSSGAKTIGLIQGGADLITALKQSSEFGITQNGLKLAVTFAQIADIKALGLELGHGLTFTEAFYWDADDAKRKFAVQFAARNGGKYPTSVHAGTYSSVLHYLRAVDAIQSDDGRAAIAKMKGLPVTDPVLGPGILRSDGRMVHDMYLVEVKLPSESHAEWDLYKIIRKVPGEEAFRPKSQLCSLVAEPR